MRHNAESSKSRLAPVFESEQEDIACLYRTWDTTRRSNLDCRFLRTKQSVAELSENRPAFIGKPGVVPQLQVAAGIDQCDRAVANHRIAAPKFHLSCRESSPETGAVIRIFYVVCEAS